MIRQDFAQHSNSWSTIMYQAVCEAPATCYHSLVCIQNTRLTNLI